MKAGDVVLMNFPFSDLSGSKLRPAVVLASVTGGDFISCQMTTNAADPACVGVEQKDFRQGSLRAVGYARPSKLFTAHRKLVVGPVGRLKPAMI